MPEIISHSRDRSEDGKCDVVQLSDKPRPEQGGVLRYLKVFGVETALRSGPLLPRGSADAQRELTASPPDSSLYGEGEKKKEERRWKSEEAQSIGLRLAPSAHRLPPRRRPLVVRDGLGNMGGTLKQSQLLGVLLIPTEHRVSNDGFSGGLTSRLARQISSLFPLISLTPVGLDAVGLAAAHTGLEAVGLDAVMLDAVGLDAVRLDAVRLDAVGLDAVRLDAARCCEAGCCEAGCCEAAAHTGLEAGCWSSQQTQAKQDTEPTAERSILNQNVSHSRCRVLLVTPIICLLCLEFFPRFTGESGGGGGEVDRLIAALLLPS
ncbi:hypothetical protein EYF80_024331 [Liparis tanakae]|uniref:Uncharacterized protein n=1 Tax=Liparis tanakae TaxID=230148 RepID=A0A4Z2HKZ5_9TELE|nr:hypothetical protein EYF80_024331 [Liparis tanakae]